MPTELGQSCLTPLISVRGGLAGDLIATLVSDNEHWVFGSSMAERFDKRFFEQFLCSKNVIFEGSPKVFGNLALPNQGLVSFYRM